MLAYASVQGSVDEQKNFLTYRFRIKGGSSVRRLNLLCSQVNLIWNFCNETSYNAIRNHSHWISYPELDKLLTGTSKITDLHSQTIQAISKEYVTRRIQHKKRKLRWRVSRGSRKSLGWVPFKPSAIKIDGNRIRYAGQEYKFWDSWDGQRPHQRSWKQESIKIVGGNFSEDSKGNWYLNLSCQVNAIEAKQSIEEVGIDPGLKDSMTLSDGSKIENLKVYQRYEEKLAQAQKRGKKKQARNIHRKIVNKRRDQNHKDTTAVVRKYKNLYVGNVSGVFLQKTNGKSSTDASIGKIRVFLKYKAMRHSGSYNDVSEVSSTVACSVCFKKTGPSGLSNLGVREWSCSECGSHHDRDMNAARNILRFGRESLKQPERAA